jgi:small-conductance mechanosensitive channel
VPSPGSSADTASLVVQNRVVFVFRAPFGSRTARERADDASRRIAALAESESSDSIAARLIAQGMLVAVGERGVFTITPADIDSIAGETLGSASRGAVERLQVALVAEREQRSLSHLATAIAFSIIATVLFLAVLRLLRRGQQFALERMPTVAGPRIPRLAVAGFTLLNAEQILAFLRRMVEVLAWGLGLFAAYLWLTYVLTRFPYSAPWGEALGAYLITTIRNLALGALGAIPGLFTVVLIFLSTRFLTRLVGGFFAAVESGGVSVPWVHVDTAQPTRRLLSALLWMFALVVAYPYLPGSGSDVFKGVSVFVGIVLSLGSSGVVSQAMSGLVLMYSRALKPGDYVRIGETEGTVAELGMLSTKIRTNKDEEVTLPNGVVVGTTTKNFSRLASERGVVLYTAVTIGYDVPWRHVHEMLIAAARRTEGIGGDPPPFVLQTALSDWYVEYQLNVRLNEPQRRARVLSDLHANIQDVFYENGVDILSPHFEGDHVRPTVVGIPRERWYGTGG